MIALVATAAAVSVVLNSFMSTSLAALWGMINSC
jgi:hypothetical protein